ncbi:unnamed protein product, partial [Rotaria magnacalcarata]
MRANICHEPSIASIITERQGSVKTIPKADRAASHVSAIAIPTIAFAKAGASFTPSPKMPVGLCGPR